MCWTENCGKCGILINNFSCPDRNKQGHIREMKKVKCSPCRQLQYQKDEDKAKNIFRRMFNAL